jgi:hypothetical protein
MPAENPIKILFRFFSEALAEETTEILLVEAVNADHGYYKLQNIPFYAANIAMGDTVWAQYKEADKMLVYRKTVERSGNSTIHAVMVNDEHDINGVTKTLEGLGCIIQKLNAKYFAISVPAAADYFPIKQKLNELEKEKVIEYAESCMSENHYYVNAFFK